MGSPYLKTGESIILTTGRVSVNNVQYDLLLTPRYLILVDNRYTEYQPRMIPLLTIHSVKGGTTAGGEMVITLFFADTSGTGESGSMILLFSQQTGEHRKSERDEWLKKLMEFIVSVRQDTGTARITVHDQAIDIRPSVRRPGAPEIPRPYKRVINIHPDQIDLIITHDTPEQPVILQEAPAVPEISPGEGAGVEGVTAPDPDVKIPGGSGEMAGSPEILPAPVPGIEEDAGTPGPGAGPMDTISPPQEPETGGPVALQEKLPEPAGTVSSPETIPDALPVTREGEREDQGSYTGSLPVRPAGRETASPETPSSPIPVFTKPPVDPDSSEEPVATRARAEGAKIHDPAVLHKKLPEPAGTVTVREPTPDTLPVTREEEWRERESFTDYLLVKTAGTDTGLPETASPRAPVPEEKQDTAGTAAGSMDTASPPGAAESPGYPKARGENAGSAMIAAQEDAGKTAAEVHEDILTANQTSAPEQAAAESAPVPVPAPGLSETAPPGTGEAKSPDQPAAEPPSPVQSLPPPSPGPHHPRSPFIAIAAGIVIILLVACAVIVYSPFSAVPGINQTLTPTPGNEQTPVPNPSLQPVSVPTQVVQQTGVWVRVVYSRNYTGWIGIPGRVRDISGSSEKMYKLFDGDGIAQVKIHKEDNTGDVLTVELYREGEVIDSRKVTTPLGSIEYMLDTKTSLPPGITPVATQTTNQTGFGSGQIVYF